MFTYMFDSFEALDLHLILCLELIAKFLKMEYLMLSLILYSICNADILLVKDKIMHHKKHTVIL